MDRIEKMEKDAARIQQEHYDMLSAAAAREKALRADVATKRDALSESAQMRNDLQLQLGRRGRGN